MNTLRLGTYRETLNGETKQACDALVSHWLDYSMKVAMPWPGLSGEESAASLRAAVNDHPEIFWVDTDSPQTERSGDAQDRIVTIRFSVLFDEKALIKARAALDGWRQALLGQMPDVTPPREKFRLLYDCLARQIVPAPVDGPECRTLLGAVSPELGADSEGAAKALKYLLDGCGIPCAIINGEARDASGTVAAHTWNLCLIEDRLWHTDVTRNMEYARANGRVREEGLLMTAEEASSLGYAWDSSILPLF